MVDRKTLEGKFEPAFEVIESLQEILEEKSAKKYEVNGESCRGFNPSYEVLEESLNINPLSARSCKCYPCKC